MRIKEELEALGVEEQEFAEILDGASAGLDAEQVAESVYSNDYLESEKSYRQKVSDYLPSPSLF